LSRSVSHQGTNGAPGPVAPIAELMSAFPAHWALCGGWAIDAWLGRQTRDHQDVDISVFIQDQQPLFDHLAGWQLVAHGPSVPVDTNEQWDGRRLDLPVHIHGRLDTGEAPPDGDLTPQQGFSLDIQFGDRSGDEWLLSREPPVTLAIRRCAGRSGWGLPTVVPEVLLFFKATAYFGIEDTLRGGRYQDEPDFLALLPRLGGRQREWLREAIGLVQPGHPWLARLDP
jgi:hypothetical protein